MCVFSLLRNQQNSTFISIPYRQADSGFHQIITGENLTVAIEGAVPGFVQLSDLIHFSRVQSFQSGLKECCTSVVFQAISKKYRFLFILRWL